MVTATANRTISFPDATGTVGLVAGSNGQVTYNDAGANAGLATVTTDGTDVTLTGRFISSLNGAASAPPGTFTGTWFTGGTATTTKPQLLIEPTGTTSTAWSTSGTGLGVNAASGFSGNLLDLQVNGIRRLSVSNDKFAAVNLTSYAFYIGTSLRFYFVDTRFALYSSGEIAWSSAVDANGSVDLSLARDSAGVVKVTNGSTGTGYIKQDPVAVSALPAAATVGAGTRGFVNDANATTFASVVAGGGANVVPVYSDGTDWRIG